MTNRLVAALLTIAAVGLLAQPVRAADEPKSPPATNPAGAIAPFLDDQTVIVGRADLSAVDPGVVAEWVLGVAKDVKFAGQDEIAKQVGEFRPVAEKWLADFRKAGGREIYVLVNLTDLAGGAPV